MVRAAKWRAFQMWGEMAEKAPPLVNHKHASDKLGGGGGTYVGQDSPTEKRASN